MNTRAEHLIALDHTDVSNILSMFSREFAHVHSDALVIREAKLVPLVKPSHELATSDPMMGVANAVPTYTDAQLREQIAKLDGSDRQTWMDAGYAIHAHHNGAEVGLTIWELWSKAFDGYEEGECEYQWGFMRANGGISVHTLVARQKKKEKDKQPTLEDFIGNYVFIEKGSQVASRRKSIGESVVSLADFRNTTMNQSVFVEKKDGTTTAIQINKMWMSDPTRVTVYSTLFAPGQGRVCKSTNRTMTADYWNTYVDPGWDLLTEPNAHKLKYFTDHVHYLFGGKGNNDGNDTGETWFYTWAAQMLQNPQDRKTITLLHISTHTRTGRGWLSEIMREMVGLINTSDTTISAMGNDGAKNGYMYNTILCTIAEVREAGKDRYSVSDSIKKKVTDEYQDVDVKYGDQALMKIYTRFFMQSNHADPLILDDGDARFNIYANHDAPKTQGYYDRLYSIRFDEEFMNSVYTFLMNYKVDESRLTRVMKTQAREDVIMATKSATASAFIVLSRLVEGYEQVQLESFMQRYHELHSSDMLFQMNHKELSYLEKEYCRSTMTVNKLVGDNYVKANIRTFKQMDITDATQLLQNTNTQIDDYFSQWAIKNEKETT